MGKWLHEQWPVARILRDAQVNTVWEGADNILCLDVRRAMLREEAHLPFFGRVRDALGNGGSDDWTTSMTQQPLEQLESAIERWQTLDPMTGPVGSPCLRGDLWVRGMRIAAGEWWGGVVFDS